MAYFLNWVNNTISRIAAIAVSAGSADADKLPATNSNGILDNSFINWASPGSIGSTTPNTAVFTGATIGSNTASSPILAINGVTGSGRNLNFQSAGVGRWTVRATAGDDFEIAARDDTGTLIDSPLSIARASGGSITFARSVVIPGGTINNATIGATTASTIRGTTTATGALIVGGGAGITGNINVGGTSHSFGSNANSFTFFGVNGAVGGNRQLVFQTAGSTRWNFYTNSTAESGSNAGSNFLLSYYSDAGAYLGDIFSATRTGSLSIVAATAFTNTTDSSSSTTGTTFAGGAGVAKNLNVGGNFAVSGTLKVSSGGSTITRVLLASSSTLDTVSFAASEIKTATVTVTGAAIGDQVNVNPSSSTPNTNFSVWGYVSATNTITIVAQNRNTTTSQSFSGNVKVSVLG